MARTRDYREHLDEVLKNAAEAVAYLNAALAEDDPERRRIRCNDRTG
jgi:DNA-binding phage protein